MLKPVILSTSLLVAGLLGVQLPGPAGPANDPLARRGASGRRLLPQVDTLLLMRVGRACACPGWSTLENREKCDKRLNPWVRPCLFIEPATRA